MAQKRNNLPIIIAAVAAIGGVVGLNVIQQRADPKFIEQEEQEREAKDAAAKQKTSTALQQESESSQSPGANEVVIWGPEKVLGKVGGTPKVVVAWEWTPSIQGNPSSVADAVEAVQKTLPGSEVDVINLDAKPGAAPIGISINGTVQVEPQPGGIFPPAAAIGHFLVQK